jgi:hypothetical protein
MKTVGWIVVIVLLILAVNIVGYTLGWFGKAADVVQREIDPEVLQRKYEWFKESAASLDAKMADISVYNNRFQSIGGKPGQCPQSADRVTREQCMVWVQEVSGIIASYNDSASQYNAEMSKWNWRFANIGELPRGTTEPLPREFRRYQYN